MKKIILILTLSLACVSCKNQDEKQTDHSTEISFDKQKWKIKEGEDYPYRESMLNDLISSKVLKIKIKAEILDMLGEPDRIENNHLFYLIEQNRVGFWPITTKTLVIKLKKGDTVEWVKVHG